MVGRVRETLDRWADRGIVDSVDEDELREVVRDYEQRWDASVQERVGRAGAQWVEAALAFEVLERREVALRHAPDRIEGYDNADSYPGLVEEYAELTDGLLDDVEYKIGGDWRAGEDAHLVLELDSHRVEGTVEYNQEYVEFGSFISLLNELVETATDDPRRFEYVPFSNGSIVFVDPDDVMELWEYFDDAYGARTDM